MKKILVLLFVVYAPFGMAKRIIPGYTLKKGQTFEYLYTQNQKLDMTVIKLMGELEQTNKYGMYFEVKEADKNEANLIFKLKSFELTTKNLNDTNNINTPGPTQGIDSLIQKHIINRTYFIRMDKYGNIVSITPPEFKIKPYEMDTLKYDALMEFANKENIKTLINQVFMVYPRNDIFYEDNWSNINHLDAGIPITASNYMQISSIKKGANNFNVSGTFSVDKNKLRLTGADENKTIVNGNLKGKIQTNRKNGLVVSKLWEGTIEGELWVDENKVILKNHLSVSVQLLN